MITDYLSLVDYFKGISVGILPITSTSPMPISATLSTGAGGFKFFREGDTFDIISAATSKLEYPVLWLETPDWKATSEGNAIEYDIAIVALTKAAKDDRRDEQVKRNDMQILLFEVVKRIHHDRNIPKSRFRIDLGSVRATPLDRVWNSSNWGWRVEFKMTVIGDKFC